METKQQIIERLKKVTIQEVYLELLNVHSWDYPDFSDAYIYSGEWKTGKPLTSQEIDIFNEYNHDLIYERAMEHWIGLY